MSEKVERVIKPGAAPKAETVTYAGTCNCCGCEFERDFAEKPNVAYSYYKVVECPTPGCGEFPCVYRKSSPVVRVFHRLFSLFGL